MINANKQTIYYDPLTQQLFVQGNIDKSDALMIFGLSGKCVYQKKFMSTAEGWQLNTSFLKKGMYIAKTAKLVAKFIVTGQ
jgi:hypothetical protein